MILSTATTAATIFSLVWTSPALLASAKPVRTDSVWYVPGSLKHVTNAPSSSVSNEIYGTNATLSIGIDACPGMASGHAAIATLHKNPVEGSLCLDLVTGKIQYNFASTRAEEYLPEAKYDHAVTQYAFHLSMLVRVLKRFPTVPNLQTYMEDFVTTWTQKNKGAVSGLEKGWTASLQEDDYFSVTPTRSSCPILWDYYFSVVSSSSRNEEFRIEITDSDDQLVASRKLRLGFLYTNFDSDKKKNVAPIDLHVPVSLKGTTITISYGVVTSGETLEKSFRKYTSRMKLDDSAKSTPSDGSDLSSASSSCEKKSKSQRFAEFLLRFDKKKP